MKHHSDLVLPTRVASALTEESCFPMAKRFDGEFLDRHLFVLMVQYHSL